MGGHAANTSQAFDEINDDTKFNDVTLMKNDDADGDRVMEFQVGAGSTDQLDVTLSNSLRSDVGEADVAIDLDAEFGMSYVFRAIVFAHTGYASQAQIDIRKAGSLGEAIPIKLQNLMVELRSKT